MAVPAAAVASSSASSAGAGAAGGPIALAVVLALVITKEIFKARRTARREMLAKKYPPIQVETAAQRLKNLLGENGEALAVAQILTPEQQMQIGVLQSDFSYSYSEPVSTQQVPRSRQQILQDLGISSTERQQELRAKTGPIQAPGRTNPNWAHDLANILLNITGGNLNKLNKLNPNSLPYNEYYNLMMKVASGEADKIFNDIHNLLLPGGGAVYPEINYPNSEVTISKKYRYVGKEGQIEQTTITHSFKGYTTTVYIENFGFRTGRQFLMANILWGGARAGKISEAIPGPKGSENAVLNSFNNFISEQLNYNEKEKDFSKTNGYGKAFRHQLWQGIIANIFGESFAEDLGDSQERGNIYGNNEDDKQRAFRDLINNEYGRQLGLSFQGDIETIDGLVES